MKKYLLSVLALLGFATLAFGAPIANVMRSIVPETNNLYYIGTTTPSTLRYNGVFNNINVSGTCTGCGLSSVSTDSSLTGAGTSGSPLGINLTNGNTWLGTQQFSIINYANGQAFMDSNPYLYYPTGQYLLNPAGSLTYPSGGTLADTFGTLYYGDSAIFADSAIGIKYPSYAGNGVFVDISGNGYFSSGSQMFDAAGNLYGNGANITSVSHPGEGVSQFSNDVPYLTSGIGGDPLTQYLLLAGRSGGQSANGGTAANDDLTLQGTSNSTRTTSYVNLQPNGGNVGINLSAPTASLHVSTSSAATSTLKITNSATGALITDGFDVGINEAGIARLNNRENTAFEVYTNNRRAVQWPAAGGMWIPTTIGTAETCLSFKTGNLTSGFGWEVRCNNATDTYGFGAAYRHALYISSGESLAIVNAGNSLGASVPQMVFEDATNDVGMSIRNPQTDFHINVPTGEDSILKFTNEATTATTSTDGFDIGITTTGSAEIRQRENLDLNVYTNNTLAMSLDNGGQIAFGAALDSTATARYQFLGTGTAVTTAPIIGIKNTTDDSAGKNGGIFTQTRMTNNYLQTSQNIGQNDNSFGSPGVMLHSAIEYSDNAYTTIVAPTEFSGYGYQYYNGSAYKQMAKFGIEGLGIHLSTAATRPVMDLQIQATTTAAATEGTQEMLMLNRIINSGVAYPQIATFALGTYSSNGAGNSFGPDTRLDLRLKAASSDNFLTDMVAQTWLDNGRVGIGTTTPFSTFHVTAGANATTTTSIGSIGLTTSKGCVNMNRSDGGAGSFYLNAAGTIVSEANYCR